MPFVLAFAETPTPPTLRGVQVGDTAHRLLCGVIPMDLKVTAVTDELIYCGEWTFDRKTGVEVDADLSVSASRLSGITFAENLPAE